MPQSPEPCPDKSGNDPKHAPMAYGSKEEELVDSNFPRADALGYFLAPLPGLKDNS